MGQPRYLSVDIITPLFHIFKHGESRAWDDLCKAPNENARQLRKFFTEAKENLGEIRIRLDERSKSAPHPVIPDLMLNRLESFFTRKLVVCSPSSHCHEPATDDSQDHENGYPVLGINYPVLSAISTSWTSLEERKLRDWSQASQDSVLQRAQDDFFQNSRTKADKDTCELLDHIRSFAKSVRADRVHTNTPEPTLAAVTRPFVPDHYDAVFQNTTSIHKAFSDAALKCKCAESHSHNARIALNFSREQRKFILQVQGRRNTSLWHNAIVEHLDCDRQLPHFHQIPSLCSHVQTADKIGNGSCFHFMVGTENLLRRNREEEYSREQLASPTLSELVDKYHLAQRNARALAVQLARSALYLYNGPWLARTWTEDSIICANAALSNSPTAYLTTALTDMADDSSSNLWDQGDIKHPHPNILSLGMLLIALHLGKTAKGLAEMNCLETTGQAAYYRLAKELARRYANEDRMTSNYLEAVKHCLSNSFAEDEQGEPLDINSTRAEIFEKIVVPLEQDLASYGIKYNNTLLEGLSVVLEQEETEANARTSMAASIPSAVVVSSDCADASLNTTHGITASVARRLDVSKVSFGAKSTSRIPRAKSADRRSTSSHCSDDTGSAIGNSKRFDHGVRPTSSTDIPIPIPEGSPPLNQAFSRNAANANSRQHNGNVTNNNYYYGDHNTYR